MFIADDIVVSYTVARTGAANLSMCRARYALYIVRQKKNYRKGCTIICRRLMMIVWLGAIPQ